MCLLGRRKLNSRVASPENVSFLLSRVIGNKNISVFFQTYKCDDSEALEYDVHFWIGKYSTQVRKLFR